MEAKTEKPNVRYLEEHKRINGVVATLEQWLGDKKAPEEWVPAVMHHLSELGEVLAPHFRGEREGALYTEAPVKVPHLAQKIERLMTEHQAFLTELGAIHATAQASMDPDAALMNSIRDRTVALIAALRQHKAEENEILMAAFWDDLGVGD